MRERLRWQASSYKENVDEANTGYSSLKIEWSFIGHATKVTFGL